MESTIPDLKVNPVEINIIGLRDDDAVQVTFLGETLDDLLAGGATLEDLAAATKIWRRMYETEEQLAGDGLKFLKAEVAKRW